MAQTMVVRWTALLVSLFRASMTVMAVKESKPEVGSSAHRTNEIK
jgi:hypothetical protein